MELFMKALLQLKDKQGTVEDVFLKMKELDKQEALGLVTYELLLYAKDAKAKGLIEVAYDPKRRVDLITVKE